MFHAEVCRSCDACVLEWGLKTIQGREVRGTETVSSLIIIDFFFVIYETFACIKEWACGHVRGNKMKYLSYTSNAVRVIAEGTCVQLVSTKRVMNVL